MKPGDMVRVKQDFLLLPLWNIRLTERVASQASFRKGETALVVSVVMEKAPAPYENLYIVAPEGLGWIPGEQTASVYTKKPGAQ